VFVLLPSGFVEDKHENLTDPRKLLGKAEEFSKLANAG
jgi:hypothetical protein